MSNMNLVPINNPRRNRMDLSYKHLFSGNMGIAYPVGFKYCIPGDKIKVGSNIFLRMMPMVAPILTNVRVKTRTFFMPFTAMHGPDGDFDFREFYKQGRDGKDSTMVIPKWIPTVRSLGSLWNFLEGPDVDLSSDSLSQPDKFLLWMYNYVINHFFISPDIEEPRDLEDETLFRVNWRKDYFGGCTLQQQRGTSPTLPTQVSYLGSDNDYHQAFMSSVWGKPADPDFGATKGNLLSDLVDAGSSLGIATAGVKLATGMAQPRALSAVVSGAIEPGQGGSVYGSNLVLPAGDYSPLVTTPVSVNDLRLAFAVQRYLETNNRAGSRYVDQLRVRFGIAPRDEFLQEPVFLGGSSTPIIVSEVLQTSATSDVSPQGNLAGHGITIDRSTHGYYKVKDFGILMTIMYVVPDVEYVSQGIDRQCLTNTYLDLYSPELANIGDMPVKEVELFATNSAGTNGKTFGFRGAWDWMRFSRNRVSGKLASDLSYWHLAREFDSAPNLNTDFIKCNPKKDFLADPSEDTFICEFLNIYKFKRPIPKFAIPRM